MKRSIVILTVLSLFTLATQSCRNKSAEKKIAQLESRIAELEGQQGGSTSGTPAVTPVAAQKPDGPVAAMKFETEDHDFGTINEGDEVEYTYKFKNTGEVPLVIESAQGSCGCTVPEKPEKPIPVGEESVIKVKFNSNGKSGMQNKTVTIIANTWPKQTELRLTAMVTPKDKPTP